MITSDAESATVINGFEEHHEILQLVNDDRSASDLLNIFITRQCSDNHKTGHRLLTSRSSADRWRPLSLGSTRGG